MPVQDKKLKLLGKITRLHGYGGEVIVNPENDLREELKEREWVFIEIEGRPVPFFISILSRHSSGKLVLKFDNYDNSEVMKEFIGCRIFLRHDEQKDNNKIAPHLIFTGYKVYDSHEEYLGEVEKVMILPMQYMLVLRGEEGGEKLIPLNEEWMVSIDRERKVMIMDLPDGMLDINE